MPDKPRIVIDTNVFVSGVINPVGVPGALLAAWRQEQVTLLIAPLLPSKYSEVLRRPTLGTRHQMPDAALSVFFTKSSLVC